jgi:hypothetical protein
MWSEGEHNPGGGSGFLQPPEMRQCNCKMEMGCLVIWISVK